MFNRHLNIFNKLADGSSLLLLGPRGVGKSRLSQDALARLPSTLQYDLLERATYMDLSSNPTLFLSQVRAKIQSDLSVRTVVLIDEVQKLPELLDEVHLLIESYPNNVSFLLTGSSARKLKATGVNLLAGRAYTVNLFPLMFEEAPLDLDWTLLFGSLPKAVNQKSTAKEFLTSYVDTYLKEEIFQEALVRRMNSFARFLEVAGQFNGEFPNFSRIGKATGVSGNTVKEYFSILEDTLVVTRIDSFSYSTIQQLREAPKYYFFDCGVLNAVRSELQVPLRRSTSRYGKLFETLIINEIVRTNSYSQSGFKLYHWHTHSGQEVDLILARGAAEPPTAIEIKSSALPEKHELNGLRKFAEEFPEARLLCLCQTQEEFDVDNIKVLPWKKGISYIFKNYIDETY